MLRELLHLIQVHFEVIGEVLLQNDYGIEVVNGFEAAVFAAFLPELQLYQNIVALIFELNKFLGVHLVLISGHELQLRIKVVIEHSF